ncbi:phosphomannomutase/phosphoglucomutase [Sphaerisporangium krabiense]|uniref:Phosphomannomutase n=1 Tax=Sphaerisporangium krabiense TaxID=763782 RepID=A0A7W9DNW0_9ACTN|nr:phosphomannomutase/phosphoglucomutase [Sphaerisporangium krabiense]MBB5624655.1 phosphomannomutase [Sphaerisporangium krabiense]GII61388.1 phosphomannomutase/phosphoglucomutase [Sphaerisporangium krabiense]
MGDLPKIFKAYDVRGVVPEELDERAAEAVGAAFVEVLGAGALVIARDMRPSSGPLAEAFARGATGRGAEVVDAGLGSTDLLYYASGSLGLPGVMFTASHNPARYNGMKLCRAGAVPMSAETGLTQVRDRAAELLASAPGGPGEEAHGDPGAGAQEGVRGGSGTGSVVRRDLLDGYAAHLRGLVDLSGIRPLKVVVDAGNGMAGHTVPTVFAGLPVELTPLYFELDGDFPNHPANPLEPDNLRDLQKAVLDKGADVGLAFDGDADRCWVVDERGESVSPSAITALVAVRELARHPGATIIHNLITSRAVPEIVAEHGGVPVRTRVGHSFIKAEMARTGAVFGGEHSAHYYFKDFWFADSGLLAALHLLAALGEREVPLSDMLASYARYAASGEINSTVADQAATVARVRAAYEGRPGTSTDDLDGLTVSGPGWWFNLRPSNTEPLLRLNAEGADETLMAAVRDEVLAIVRS